MYALELLTIIPVRIQYGERDAIEESLVWFPFAGLLIGFVMAITGYISGLFSGALFSAMMITLSGIIMSGGLHADGLADTADGLFSRKDKDRMLEIMKDSRIGTFGVLALMVVLMARFAAIAEFAGSNTVALLIIVPVAGRVSLILSCYKTVPARNEGMGQAFIGKSKTKTVLSGIAFLSAAAFLCYRVTGHTGVLAPLLFPLILIPGILINTHITRKIGGLTGDTLGAVSEITETAACMYLMIV